jgi:hypothetical protein
VIKSTLKSEPDGHARREMHIATESNTCAPAPAMTVVVGRIVRSTS